MSDSYSENLNYRFEGFTLDVRRGALRRGDEELRIRPRSFEVLRYLLERQGKVVGRDELIDALWEGTVVTDDAVTQCLIDIRKALGDDAQSIVRTVPRRGYIFEAPVEVIDPTAQAPGKSRVVALAVVASLLALLVAFMLTRTQDKPDLDPGDGQAKPSIAVMPFESMGPDREQTYFADGVSEEIINSLASQPDLKVIARTSSFSFRGEQVDVATIAKMLDVSHVLEGSVRNDGDALRINVQLVDADTGNYIWTRQYDRELSASSVFAIQSEIATAVVESLQYELTARNRERLSRVATDDMAALNNYFAARQAMETRGPDELDRAARLLREAIQIDPDFALAYAALAETIRLQANYGSLPPRLASRTGDGGRAERTAHRSSPGAGVCVPR